jgi:hypothetical protein
MTEASCDRCETPLLREISRERGICSECAARERFSAASDEPNSGPRRCHCGGWFNPDMYAECLRCRTALAEAVAAVRRELGARVIGTPSIPPQLPMFDVEPAERRLVELSTWPDYRRGH